MSERHDSDDYGWQPYGGQQQLLGYDEYGRPVYAQDAGQGGRQQTGTQEYGDGQPYGTGAHPGGGNDDAGAYHGGSVQGTGAYGSGAYGAGGYAGGGYDPYGPAADTGAGGYGSGAYNSGTFDTGTFDTRTFDTGTFDTGDAGTYDTGTFDPYDPYGTQTGAVPPVTDPYAGAPADPYAADPYGGPGSPGTPGGREEYDPYGPAADTGAGQDTGTVPAQSPPPAEEQVPSASRRGATAGGDSYDTDEFSFVEEDSEESEDVIDWLKFSESRTERREEAKRRGRNRKRALVIVLVLAVLGGVGYLWWAGKLPGLDGGPGAGGPAAGQQRDVLVVHLRDPDSEANSTALLVDNSTTEQGTTLLLPNALAVTTSDGSTTTLGKSVEAEGATPTRDALNRLLGADIKGTWRLDTPFLETLVDAVGGVTLDADVTVPGEKKDADPLVEKGKARELDGRAAVAYATHREDAEPKTAQLERFGQVMEAVLGKLSTDEAATTKTVESLGQILDPSLSQASLGASLASLAARAQADAYATEVLPVEPDGTLSADTSDGMVKDVLGGTVQNSDPDAAPRVSLRNAAGDEGADDAARVTLINGGFSVVGASEADGTEKTSKVLFADAGQKERARAVAKTLGLPEDSVQKGDAAGNADVTVVLGQDFGNAGR